MGTGNECSVCQYGGKTVMCAVGTEDNLIDYSYSWRKKPYIPRERKYEPSKNVKIFPLPETQMIRASSRIIVGQ